MQTFILIKNVFDILSRSVKHGVTEPNTVVTESRLLKYSYMYENVTLVESELQNNVCVVLKSILL